MLRGPGGCEFLGALPTALDGARVQIFLRENNYRFIPLALY